MMDFNQRPAWASPSRGYDFEAIKLHHPLSQTISQDVQLKRNGSELVGLCPFHHEKSPSFHVNDDKGFYHCFGCGAHGDVLDYVMEARRLELPEAIKELTGGITPTLTASDRQARARQRDAEEKAYATQRAKARDAAEARWNAALPVNGVGNGYLTRKNVAPYGTRREGDKLLVPIMDANGTIMSVQSIAEDGRKLFQPNAAVKGGRYILEGDATMVVAEGFATAATIHAATGHTVAIAFSKDWMRCVAETIRAHEPNRTIIIAADLGAEQAGKEAASAVGGRLLLPEMLGAEGTDFNDQAAHYGLDDVKALFAPPTQAEVVHTATNELGFRITDWSMDRFFGEAPPINWLCEGAIPLGVPALFAAMGGVGKSFMALDLALEIASEIVGNGQNRRILGGPIAARGSVVVLSAEDGKDSVHRRLERIDTGGRRLGAKGKMFVVPLPEVGGPMPLIVGSAGKFEKTPKFDALLAQLQTVTDLRLLVIDPLQAFVTADITKDPGAGQFMWSSLAQVCALTGATVIACHHMRKEGSSTITTAEGAREAIRGSTALIDGARATYALWGASDDDTRSVCTEANVEYRPKRVVHGAVVKANDEHDWEVHTYLRGESGLLVDAQDAGRRAGQRSNSLTEQQAMATLKIIDTRWRAGRPYSASANTDRYIVTWMMREFKVSRGAAKNQLDTWFHAEMVMTETANAKTKMTGLRVVKWPE